MSDLRVAIATLSLPNTPTDQRQAAAELLLARPTPATVARVKSAADAADGARHGAKVAQRLRALAAEMEERLPEPEPLPEELEPDYEAVLATFLHRASTPLEREEAEKQLDELPGRRFRETVRRVGDALEGIWPIVKTPAEVEARRVIARWYVDAANMIGIRVMPLMPDFLKVTTADGRTGTIRAGYGTGLYNFHYEFPVDGFGVRKDEIFVVEDDRRTPILDWLQQKSVRVMCTRCGGFLDRKVEEHCPARGLALHAQRRRRS